MIRKYKDEDLDDILKIYNYYISNSIATLELEEVDYKTLNNRFSSIKNKYPFYVYEEGGKVRGYAYLDSFNFRAAYDMSLDLTIYIEKDFKHKGIGLLLLNKIKEEAKKINIYNIISLVTVLNVDSCLFHEKNGFEKVGEISQVAYKFDMWQGLRYYRLKINENEKYRR